VSKSSGAKHLRQEPARPDGFDGLIPVSGIHLPQDAMHVILDGLFGKMQRAGDLLVVPSFSDE
jgi:hypothetical protein